MPAAMEFSFDLSGKAASPAPRRERTPMRILLLGDFSALPAAERPPLAGRPTYRVDVDNLDRLIARLAPRLSLPIGELAFAAIDDFHPDALHARLPSFQALREARTRQAAGDLLGGLLGKPAVSASSAASPGSGIDGWIRSVVAPHIVADTAAQDQGYRSAVDVALANADAAAQTGWTALRSSQAAPWLGLVAPRLLLRQPYGNGSDPISAFAFEEITGTPSPTQFLWGEGALAVALIVGRAFSDSGWDFDADDDRDIGDLPSFTHRVDGERQLLPCAEQALDAKAATALLNAGLMPLQAHRNRNAVTLMRVQSISEPAAALFAAASAGA